MRERYPFLLCVRGRDDVVANARRREFPCSPHRWSDKSHRGWTLRGCVSVKIE